MARPLFDGGGLLLAGLGVEAGALAAAALGGAGAAGLAWLQLAVASLVCFALMGWDKWRAARARRRMRESALLALALCGGAPGAVAAMVVFRHKLRPPAFRFLLPAAGALHLAALVAWAR